MKNTTRESGVLFFLGHNLFTVVGWRGCLDFAGYFFAVRCWQLVQYTVNCQIQGLAGKLSAEESIQ
jgi:hypothetical protein